VKGVALNLTQSSEKIYILGKAEPLSMGAGESGADDKDECATAAPESKTASSSATTGK
jgi:hypothetical protein